MMLESNLQSYLAGLQESAHTGDAGPPGLSMRTFSSPNFKSNVTHSFH